MRLFQLFEHIGHGSVLTSPAHTVVVDTPSDLDWYKLGQHFPTLMNQDPREFNAGSSDTVITFANKEEADKFRSLMKLNGVTTMDIGGSHIHPEIHSDNSEVDETIRKVGNKYRLYSKKGKNLGTYDSREAAENREQQVNYFKHMNEGWQLQLERDPNMYVLHITDTKTGKRTEVRGKPDYETTGYDANDPLHKLLDKIGKASSISDLMNGEVVGVNPRHPSGSKAMSAADRAFNEENDTLELPDIEVGDEVMVGKFKNRKAVVTGFEKDEHNQPVLNTTKGNQKLFKPRLSKLVKE